MMNASRLEETRGEDTLTLADTLDDPAAVAALDAADDAVFTAELHTALDQAMNRLQPIQKEIIISRYYRGEKLQDIAIGRAFQDPRSPRI